jgi:hypothetical protein
MGEGDYMTKGRSDEELIAEAQRTGGNVAFAQTRDEKTLKPTDIQNYAQIVEKAGKDATNEDRYIWAKRALDSGAVREHHGTVDVDWTNIGSTPFTDDERGAAKTDLAALQKLIDANTARDAAENGQQTQAYSPQYSEAYQQAIAEATKRSRKGQARDYTLSMAQNAMNSQNQNQGSVASVLSMFGMGK